MFLSAFMFTITYIQNLMFDSRVLSFASLLYVWPSYSVEFIMCQYYMVIFYLQFIKCYRNGFKTTTGFTSWINRWLICVYSIILKFARAWNWLNESIRSRLKYILRPLFVYFKVSNTDLGCTITYCFALWHSSFVVVVHSEHISFYF